MDVTRRHADRTPRNSARYWAVGLAIAGIIGVAAGLVATVLALIVARAVVTPPRRRAELIRVCSIVGAAGDGAAATVTFNATTDSLLPGQYSYFFNGDSGRGDVGAAQIGAILAVTADSVTRAVIGVSRGTLAPGVRGRFSGWFYLDPSDLAVPFHDILLETELGPAPAWVIPADNTSGSSKTHWVIQVHGRAVRRQETLRAVAVFRSAGFTSLIISYRNDGDAPASADGRYALGDAEWRDIDVALRYALDNGATDVVLMGWSMGGAAVLQELTRSPAAAVIRGVVLESPVIDWVTAVRFQGALRRLPRVVSKGALAFIGTTHGRRLTGQGAVIDLPRLDFVARANELTVPVLILHSDDDALVPITASRLLAAARPDIVTFEAFSVAGHTKLWNFDPVRWNSAIAQWLASPAVSGVPSTARS